MERVSAGRILIASGVATDREAESDPGTRRPCYLPCNKRATMGPEAVDHAGTLAFPFLYGSAWVMSCGVGRHDRRIVWRWRAASPAYPTSAALGRTHPCRSDLDDGVHRVGREELSA